MPGLSGTMGDTVTDPSFKISSAGDQLSLYAGHFIHISLGKLFRWSVNQVDETEIEV